METRERVRGWRRAVTPFPRPSSLCLASQRQPVLVWLLSSPRYHLQLFVLCLLLVVDWNNVIVPPRILPDLGFLALVGFSLNFWAAGAHEHRIRVYLLAGQEVEGEISMCGEGEGKKVWDYV